MQDEEAGKTESKREGQGVVFDESPAYYKLKILPSLVCSRQEEVGGGWGVGGWGTVYICASVAPHPTAGGWSLRGGSTSLRGKQQVDQRARGSVFVLYICLNVGAGLCWACVQKSVFISTYNATSYTPVALVKTSMSHRACVSGQA